MPTRPKNPCRHQGCPGLTDGKYCNEHKKLYAGDRLSAAERGYGSRWRRARQIYLKANPLCAYCKEEGRFTKATVVDHIIPHRGDAKLFWDQSNWQALCKRCHDTKTMTDDRYKEYTF